MFLEGSGASKCKFSWALNVVRRLRSRKSFFYLSFSKFIQAFRRRNLDYHWISCFWEPGSSKIIFSVLFFFFFHRSGGLPRITTRLSPRITTISSPPNNNEPPYKNDPFNLLRDLERLEQLWAVKVHCEKQDPITRQRGYCLPYRSTSESALQASEYSCHTTCCD